MKQLLVILAALSPMLITPTIAISAPLGQDRYDASASQAKRGLWMYYHRGKEHGLNRIIGDDIAQSIALSNLQFWSVGRVYGSYSNLPITHANEVAYWNKELAQRGIESQLLLGMPTHIFPGSGCREKLLTQLKTRLIDFHNGENNSPPLQNEQRFSALHLDIEPHQFKTNSYKNPPTCAPTNLYWRSSTRAVLFAHLYDTLVAVRSYLDAHGHAQLPINIDLPYWVDSSNNFNWRSTPRFDSGIDWLTAVSEVVNGMTFMTYANDSAQSIRSKLDGENAALGGANIHPALNAKERKAWSSTITWHSLGQFLSAMEQLEDSASATSYGVDIHNYRYLVTRWPIGSVAH